MPRMHNTPNKCNGCLFITRSPSIRGSALLNYFSNSRHHFSSVYLWSCIPSTLKNLPRTHTLRARAHQYPFFPPLFVGVLFSPSLRLVCTLHKADALSKGEQEALMKEWVCHLIHLSCYLSYSTRGKIYKAKWCVNFLFFLFFQNPCWLF